MKTSYRYIIGFSVLITCFVCVTLFFLFTSVVPQKTGFAYYVHPGTSKKQVISDLSQQGVIHHPVLYGLYVYTHDVFNKTSLKTGEYYFPQGSTPYSIWKQMTNGTGFLYRPFVLVPGWTFKQLRAALLKARGLRHITATFDDKQIMERLGYPNNSPEGNFFPDTYNYTRGDVDLALLKRAFDLMQIKLQEEWGNRATDLPYHNKYEALITASMIEKEGYLDTERPMIAGVILNRINKNMLLQIDATVIYGLGDRYTGKIYKENLIDDTAYNTYLHRGLPPTPIAMPGLSSIKAAMHPQQNNYYYYVAKGDGSHYFSTSLDAHHTAVQAVMNQNDSH